MKTYIYLYIIISCSFHLRMRTVPEKVVEKLKTNILCSVTFFFFEKRAVYEIMWKRVLERGRPQTTIWRMLIAQDTSGYKYIQIV